MAADEPRRALVIHPGALGDVLQAVPALRALGHGARVTFCGQPRLGELLVGASVVHDTVSFDAFGLDTLFTDEPAPASLADRLSRFEEIVSWFGSRDERYPARLRALARAAVVAPPLPDEGHSAQRGGDDRPAGLTPRTVWAYLLDTLAPLSPAAPRNRAPLPLSGDRVPLVLPETWQVEARRALGDIRIRPDMPFVVVHPGAGGAWKIAPPHLLADALAPVMGERPVQILVHVGPADRDAAERLTRLLVPPPLMLIDPSLPLLAGILSLAAAYLGGDSGVSHLAAAVGAPAIIIFPPATRDQWTPWSYTARPITLGPAAAVAAATAAAALGEAMRQMVLGETGLAAPGGAGGLPLRDRGFCG